MRVRKNAAARHAAAAREQLAAYVFAFESVRDMAHARGCPAAVLALADAWAAVLAETATTNARVAHL